MTVEEINAIAIEEIDSQIGSVYTYCSEDTVNIRLVTLGAVRGILDMAEKVREAIKEKAGGTD